MKLKQSQRQFVFATAFAALIAVSPAVLAAVPPPGQDSSPAVAQLVAAAQKALKEGNIPLAVINLKNASSASPRNGAVRAQLGSVLLQSGDTYSAERELRQARKDGASDQVILPQLFQAMLLRHEEKSLLEEFPDSAATMNPANAADIYKAHALAFQSLGQQAEAAAAMEKSLKLRRDGLGLLARARIAQQQRDYPTAMALADEAIKLAPADLNPALFKFALLLDVKNLDSALKLSEDLVSRFPASVPARFSHVEALMRTNQNARASAEVNAALLKTPGLSIGVYYRAMLMAKAGDVKGAWRNAQTLPPQFLQSQPGTAINVSQMAENAGAKETGAAILAAAVARFSSDTNLRLRLANVRLRQNDTVGALNALEPIKDTLDPTIAQVLARIYLKAGKPNDALSLLQKVEESGKGSDSITMDIVGLQYQQGQSEEAMKSLAQAAAQKPNDPMLVGQLVTALTRAGRFPEALAAADKLGNDSAQRVPSLVFRAMVQQAQGNQDGALASYNKAVQLEPANPLSLYGRANILAALRRYEDANKDLKAILAKNPKSIPAYLKLAEVAALQGQDQVVRGTLERAIQQVPQDASPRISLVRYLLMRRNAQGALAAANDLVKSQPTNAQAIALLGQAQGAAGLKREAVATFRRVVSLAPKAAASQILLANALQAAGDGQGAASAMKAAVTLDRNSLNVRASQVNLQFAQHDAEGAVATARAFRSANPSTASDMLLGDTLEKAGHADQAADVFKQSLAIRPNTVALMRTVKMSVLAKDPKFALDAMSKWLDKNATDTPVRVEYATLLMQQGEKAKAATEYQAVLQRDPNNVVSLNNLGWLTQRDDPRRSISLLTQAVKLSPNSPEVLDTLGWVKVQQKQAPEGLSLLQRAHDLNPKDGSITYHLVQALDATGKHDAARGLLKALLASSANFEERNAATQLSAKWH